MVVARARPFRITFDVFKAVRGKRKSTPGTASGRRKIQWGWCKESGVKPITASDFRAMDEAGEESQFVFVCLLVSPRRPHPWRRVRGREQKTITNMCLRNRSQTFTARGSSSEGTLIRPTQWSWSSRGMGSSREWNVERVCVRRVMFSLLCLSYITYIHTYLFRLLCRRYFIK